MERSLDSVTVVSGDASAGSRRRGALLAAAIASLTALAAASPTGLAPGKAKGTLTVGGKSVTLTHAYATREPNPFDEKKQDIVVLLTDRPLEAAALAGDLSRATQGSKNYLRLALREAANRELAKQAGWLVLDRWEVGNRELRHEALGKSLASSPDYDCKVDAVVVGPARVEATAYTSGVQEQQGEKFEYRVSFNVAVAPAKAAAPTR